MEDKKEELVKDNNPSDKEKKNNKKDNQSKILLFIILVFVFVSMLTAVSIVTKPEKMTYNEFLEKVEEKEVEKIDLKADASNMVVFLKDEKSQYSVPNPKTDEFKEDMLLEGIEVVSKKPTGIIVWGALTTILYLGLFALIAYVLLRQFSPVSKSKFSVEKPSIKFADIAGNDEAKEDMQYLVSFLKNNKAYKEMGAKLPKGVILFGPPGTGKTLMAKAVAGESEVPFYHIAGSDFVEMFVGVGAKRARELFAEARKNSPSIIFIDEIDAVGKKRGGYGQTSEHEQTINAILNEMDGFTTKEPVIVIAATNRLDSLDPALIRAGRFDRHVAIEKPDQKARKEILKLHLRNKVISPKVDIDSLSKITIGFAGADLEALVNESAIIAVNRGSKQIEDEDVDNAYYKIAMKGSKKKDKGDDKDELKLIAYHEAGHALVAKLITDDSVHKVTIIPSTSGAGGVTFTTPKKTSLLSKTDILNNVKVLYAGRAAEEILRGSYDKITSGASQDIQQATKYLTSYFAELGMSESLGMLAFDDPKVYREEAIELSKQLYKETLELLKENTDKLENIANVLLEKETIVESELDEIIEM